MSTTISNTAKNRILILAAIMFVGLFLLHFSYLRERVVEFDTFHDFPVVLVTGGAGFIGTHTIVSLLEKRYRVISLDNYVNSSPKAISRVKEVVGPLASLRYTCFPPVFFSFLY